MIERMELSKRERAVITMLDENGLLHDMEKEHFIGKEDSFLCTCNDSRWALQTQDYFRDMYDKQKELYIFPINELGGTLALDEDSPLLEKSSALPDGNLVDRSVIKKIRFAVKMGHKAGCLINHIPCGKSREHNIDPLQIIDSLMIAKHRIKYVECITGITIACFLQIGESDGRAQFARISYEDYLVWRKDNPKGASPAMYRILSALSQ